MDRHISRAETYVAVVADHPVAGKVQGCSDGVSNVVEVEAAVKQPGDQIRPFLSGLALQAVEQPQRLEIDVRRHVVNVLFRPCRAGPEQLHLALNALEVPRTRERPGEVV